MAGTGLRSENPSGIIYRLFVLMVLYDFFKLV